jgi:hypothetical protein
MGGPTDERLRLKFQRARVAYAIKTKPIKDAEYLKAVHELAVEKMSMAQAVWLEYNDRVRPVLDEFGITGTTRVMYYVFGRRLLSFCLNYSENMWDNFAEGLKQHYTTSYRLNHECLDRIIRLTTAFAREIKGGPEVMEGGGQET